jgi:hypothetical protein
MATMTNTTLGDLITVLYDEFLAVYGDEELASVAVAATINDMLSDSLEASRSDPAFLEADAA